MVSTPGIKDCKVHVPLAFNVARINELCPLRSFATKNDVWVSVTNWEPIGYVRLSVLVALSSAPAPAAWLMVDPATDVI